MASGLKARLHEEKLTIGVFMTCDFWPGYLEVFKAEGMRRSWRPLGYIRRRPRIIAAFWERSEFPFECSMHIMRLRIIGRCLM